MTDDELIAEAQRLFDRCKLFPENDPGAIIAMIELRNIVPELLTLVHRLRRETTPSRPD